MDDVLIRPLFYCAAAGLVNDFFLLNGIKDFLTQCRFLFKIALLWQLRFISESEKEPKNPVVLIWDLLKGAYRLSCLLRWARFIKV